MSMPRDVRYDPLFQPLRIGPVTAPNRFWQVRHGTGMGNRHPAALAAMCGVKAKGGWGIVNSEYCPIRPSSDDTTAPDASLSDDGDTAAMAAVAEAVHQHDARAGVELWHSGARTRNVFSRGPLIRPDSILPETMPWQSPRMNRGDARALRDRHRAAALRALTAGLDVVYACAAHTFLLAPFLDPGVNTRGDGYGGGPAGRRAAVTLGRRGLPVVLAEAGEPGGRVTLEARLPAQSEWGRVIDRRPGQITRMPQVTLDRGSTMTAADLRETGIAQVAVATGSLRRADGRGRSPPSGAPSFADPRMLTPDAMLAGMRPAAGPAVVLDDQGYHIAAGLADLLAAEGREVTYGTPARVVAGWAAHAEEQAQLHARLIDRGVTIRTGQAVTALTSGGAQLACIYTGRASDIARGALVPVTSRGPRDAGRDLVGAALASLCRTGDARAPGHIAQAAHDGHAAARAHRTTLSPPRRQRAMPDLRPTWRPTRCPT
jgi:hypothetical protein